MSELIRDPSDDLVVIARAIVHDLLAYYDEDGDCWEQFPDIGENDWLKIVNLVRQSADLFRDSPLDYRAAHQRLAARSEEVRDESTE